MIKVNYDTETTLVKGYYPDSISYSSIPEPYIEIENDAQILGKEMCVVDGVYQEYVTPDSVLLEEGKKLKIRQCKNYLNNTDWQIIALTERGRPVDEDVAVNRPLAVSLQAEITACTILEELNNINIDFNTDL